MVLSKQIASRAILKGIHKFHSGSSWSLVKGISRVAYSTITLEYKRRGSNHVSSLLLLRDQALPLLPSLETIEEAGNRWF